ncbi:hypothetical protein ABIB42_001390 [Massilia sp. UYP32]|uniref:HD domain-containing protein n=1 Tax=Massilia sp. UYP32 TaxID=1756386 RepID=UPI003D224CAC
MTGNFDPFERFVQQQLANANGNLPDPKVNYWDQYTHLLSGLRQYVYPHVNAGLASLSKSPGIYTDHGPDHFDEVVRYAGLLLSTPDRQSYHGLEPYEYYLLLCAIRLHDAGNIGGREAHETRAADVLAQYGGNIVHNSTDFYLISSIAQAHGGKRLDGDKDTISELPEDKYPVGGTTVRPRYVAALVRFADEICEHSNRASHHMMRNDDLPDHNKLYHYYAKSIVGAVPDRTSKSFRLNLQIDSAYLKNKYPTPTAPGQETVYKYLIDEVRERIIKLDLERIYCNQFLDPSLQTNRIEVSIQITKAKAIAGGAVLQQGVLATYTYKIPPMYGYPANSSVWQDDEFFGEKIAAKIQEQT